MIAPKLSKLWIWKMRQGIASRGINVNGAHAATRRQADGDAANVPALEQHCTDVSRRPYSQPRALQCLRMYALEDNVCVCTCVMLSVLSATAVQ